MRTQKIVLVAISILIVSLFAMLVLSLQTDALFWHVLTLVPFAATALVLELAFWRWCRQNDRLLRHSLRTMLYMHAIVVTDVYVAALMAATALAIALSKTRKIDGIIVAAWAISLVIVNVLVQPRGIAAFASIASGLGMGAFARLVFDPETPEPNPRLRSRTQRISRCPEDPRVQ